MNLQTQQSSQMSGQLANQAGSILSGLPQQNPNPVPSQVQNPSMHHSFLSMDPDIAKTRRYMQEKIWEFLMQRHQQANEVPNRKIIDLVKRLEEGLFKGALTKEEYLNLETLESRLHILIKPLPMSNPNQQFGHTNSSPSMGTMIPTPGFQQTGNSNLVGNSSMGNPVTSNNSSNTITSSTVYSGDHFPTQNGPSGSYNGDFFHSSGGPYTHVNLYPVGSSLTSNSFAGTLASGYQQSSSAFSVDTRGNDMVTQMGVPRMTTQMIPTPGINNPSTNNLNNSGNNQTLKNMESSNSIGTYTAAESTGTSQPMVNKQRFGGQNSRILQNIGGLMGDGIRSALQQKPFGLASGPLNGGLGLMGKNMLMMSNSGTDGHLSGTVYGNSTKSLQTYFDQQQRPVLQGDGYGAGVADASGSRNSYAGTSVVSMMNSQSLNPISAQSIQKTDTPLITNNQLNAYSSQQMTNIKPESIDQTEKEKLQAQYSSVKGNLVQPFYHQQFQQPSNEFQHRQLAQHFVGQKNKAQNQFLLKADSFNRSQLPSNIVSEVKSEFGTEHSDGDQQSQVGNLFQVSMQHHYQHNSMQDVSRATQLLPHSSGPLDARPSSAQSSEQMQQLLNSQQVGNPHGDLTHVTGGIQPDAALHSQSYIKSLDASFESGHLHEQNVQDVLRHRSSGQVIQPNNQSSNELVASQCDSYRSAEPVNTSSTSYRINNLTREQQFKNQQKWLLFLKHAQKCPAPEGRCIEPNCLTVQKLWRHMEFCKANQCTYPRCHGSRNLYDHYLNCQATSCPVCIPVKNFLKKQKECVRSRVQAGVPISTYKPCNSYDTADAVEMSTPKAGLEKLTPKMEKSTSKSGPDIGETPGDLQPPVKRMKTELGSQPFVSETERSVALASAAEPHTELNSPVKIDVPENVEQLSPKSIEMKKENLDEARVQDPKGDSVAQSNPTVLAGSEVTKNEMEIEQPKLETTLVSSENASKSAKPKVKGVSMIELFTPLQVHEHIRGLRQWVGQSKAKAEKNQAMGHSMNENSCQLCAVEKLTFEPPPIYCTPCGARIKRNAMYYTFGSGETRHCFCIPCFNEARGETIAVDGTSIPKTRVEKRKNDEETEEWWVQCDKCEAWQHQICALFNGRRNDGGQAEYTCPNCYIEEVENGERVPLPQSAVLGAKDLPRTSLSDHLEQRLFTKLKQERKERARRHGKNYDEVPGAEALVVRVVSSVDKKLDVKPRFLEIFREQNYPSEFPYKSKVILLFQRIEGVEVCLFGMYVQEFGSECLQPNHRRVYLSYLDSVKYFRPEVKAVTGEALRTFVYHEILIGYLESCKKRGFTSCYIWACPPLKGEDYILYCHPEIQKTPKSDKLREWYLAMLRKAAKENIVVDLTNLYEHFFVSNGECKAKVTAARLPYFDGDYWPGAAEDIIYQLQQEDDGKKPNKKGTIKKSIMKRALKASGQTDLTGNASKDLMLMHKLGETISPMKEDFIMVHLQHACTHCCILMATGNRWVCRQCKKFQLCDRCYDAERKREDRERHKHALNPVEITGIPDDTKDNEILESEFFDTRQAFLTLCQVNHYQYDTLRRAKHSSMMVLYHLHNPTAPAFVTQCAVCYLDIEAGRGWRCETCPDYDVCNACYEKDGGVDHPHKLTNQQSKDHEEQNKEARQLRVTELSKMLTLLVHASQCRTTLCQYPNCRKVKGLFRHGIGCKIRASGGCPLCKRMWYLLQLHARACKESRCHVPRCKDLKEHMRRLQQQSDSRRRAAVNEMMRQRAAEVGSN